ncbi:hypothetical protein CPT_Sycamore_024 [Streptomyces phage Sycamore]|uniref:Uncharacterized protein n=1 Tax=Streptomyces phage Sycamore TaxID=2767589 RepID=A0A873WVH6_9CAUD|nr:hypothetical protein CPT_Sycamore_024 [Streptomyces phage Sycamore]
MSEQGPEIIGRELLRLDAEAERAELAGMGKNRRADLDTRRNALRWALHATLTGDATTRPGKEVEEFLGTLSGSDE